MTSGDTRDITGLKRFDILDAKEVVTMAASIGVDAPAVTVPDIAVNETVVSKTQRYSQICHSRLRAAVVATLPRAS
jgi:hypothetical protein